MHVQDELLTDGVNPFAINDPVTNYVVTTDASLPESLSDVKKDIFTETSGSF